MSRFFRYFCLFLCLILVGCGAQRKDGTPSPSPTDKPTAVAAEPSPTADPSAPPTGPIFPTGPLNFTVWMIEDLAPSDAMPGGRLLLDQLLEFDRNRPELELDVVTKRATGPGSIMDYFQTASPVAPDILPDLVVLNDEMLAQAWKQEVIQSLDDLPQILMDDLFSVAVKLGRIDDHLVGVPFRLELEHLVYNTTVFSETAPSTWDEILDSGGPYLFPAAEDAPVDTTLLHYMAAGGILYDRDGQPDFGIDPLTEVFRFYQQAYSRRVIPAAAQQTRSLAFSWNAYLSGNALVAYVDASSYLSGRDELLNTAVGATPGPNRSGAPLVSAWHWAVVATDPARQQLAVDLIMWLMEADNLGVWSFASQWLPSTAGALAAWPTDDDYVRFAQEQILLGHPRPDAAYYQVVQSELSQVVRDVMNGNQTPAEAAASVNPD